MITLLRIRRNSLEVNSFRADFWRRSIKSSPLRSTTSSLISSVDLVLISFISSSLLAIITTDEDEDDELDLRNDAVGRRMPMGHTCWSLRPLKDDLGMGERNFGGSATVEGGAMEIAPNIVLLLLLPLSLRLSQCVVLLGFGM